jgi:hypothetical protein
MPAMRAVERCPHVGFARMLSDLTAAAASLSPRDATPVRSGVIAPVDARLIPAEVNAVGLFDVEAHADQHLLVQIAVPDIDGVDRRPVTTRSSVPGPAIERWATMICVP